MRVLNVRAGFATNSSSSHSVLILADHGLRENDAYDGYGWDAFTLVDKSEKKHYLATQLAEQLGYDQWSDGEEQLGENRRIERLIADLVGPVPQPTYVDHQSLWTFPYRWDGRELHREFIADMDEFLSRDDVVILGGNDNDGEHPFIARADYHAANPNEQYLWHHGLPREYGGRMVGRKDGEHWTLFNRGTGAKFRITFSNEDIDRGTAPELVDIKITDYCPFGCPFCYQSSTTEGQHAAMADIEKVAEALGEAQVFEVAIGGGEPTLHPKFLEILRMFRHYNIVPNFTTRNLGWLGHEERSRQIAEVAGAFAYSAQSPADATNFVAKIAESPFSSEMHDYYGSRRAVMHIVMGTVTREDFASMLKTANEGQIGVTLLGWKRVGFAENQEPDHPYLEWWAETAKEHGPWRIGIDTALAAEADAAGQLDEYPSWSYHTRDGDWSMYVDAVAMTAAPSSWEPERGSWAFDAQWRERWMDA